jgi:putative peptide zinc metalloprotease protein
MTVSETPTRPNQPGQDGERPSGDGAPTLAEGVELIGKYEDSGFKDPPYMARRADGQVVQLPELLYTVVDEADGSTGYAEIADKVGERIGREVSEDNVRYLVDEKLRPLGVLAGADGANPKIAKTDQLLALKFRVSVIPDRIVRAITTVFYPLFLPPVVIAVLGGLAALDVWLFGIHGIGQSARQLLYQPGLLLLVLGLVVISAAFHECGHATACRYGGAKPGVMGAGIYIVWPAFYTDVTDAYRLGKAGRLRTDLGGVYFNAIFSLVTAGVYFATGFEPLLVIILLQHLEMLHQFLPFLRLDGYYIISDLTGVPDMFARIKPTLRSLIPWRKTEQSVEALKPWVRVATTLYVIALIPVLTLVFGFMLLSAPRIFATAWDSMFVQGDKISDAFSNGSVLTAFAGGFQFLSLLLPVAGITMTVTRTGKRILNGAWNWSDDSLLRRALVLLVSGAAASVAAFVLWPNGEYKPIQPGERGTVTGGVQALSKIQTGRPSLTKDREQELGTIQIERSKNDEIDRSRDEAPTPGSTTGETPTTSTSTSTTSTETTPTTTTTSTTTTATTTTQTTSTTETSTTPTTTTTETP